jgi:hypothetical protein
MTLVEAETATEAEAKPVLTFSTTFDPASPAADSATKLTYVVTQSDGSTPELVESHTKYSHLIVVSHDLSSFQHVHPTQTSPGTFQIDLTWPSGGDYVLFADATPKDSTSHVERIPVTVAGTPVPEVALTPTPRELAIEGYAVQLETAPAELVAGDATLTFHLSKDGQPLTTLEPYLGAMGHLVVISADTTQFLHAHPEDHVGHDASQPDMHGEHAASVATSVAFGTAFPSPGLYKAWGQFLINGKVVTAPFVVEVG